MMLLAVTATRPTSEGLKQEKESVFHGQKKTPDRNISLRHLLVNERKFILLEFNDLIVKLERLVCSTLQLHHIRHLRMDDGQLRLNVLLGYVLQKTTMDFCTATSHAG